MEKEMWVESDKQTAVPNTELIVKEDDDWYSVGTEGILAECAPGLGVRDVAEYVLSCYEIEGGFEENWWTYTEACLYTNIGWLERDASVNVSKLGAVSGIADQLTGCVSSDRVAGKSLARSGGRPRMTGRRGGQREGQGAAGKRREQGKAGKGKKTGRGSGREARREARRGGERKGGKRKGGKKSSRRVPGRRRNPREAESSSLDVAESAMLRPEPRAWLIQPRGGGDANLDTRKKKDDDKEKNKNKNKEEKKKKKKEERKILRNIPLDKLPSDETMSQLWCIRNVVMRGLKTCAGKLLAENLKDPDLERKNLLQIKKL